MAAAQQAFDFAPPSWVYGDDDEDGAHDKFIRLVECAYAEVAVMRRTCTGWDDGVELGGLYLHVRFRDDAEGPIWVMPVEADTTEAVERTAAVVRRLFLSCR